MNEKTHPESGIEATLRDVPPRPKPSEAAVRAAHQAVAQAWRGQLRRRRTRGRFALAAAASLLIATIAVLRSQAPEPAPVPVPVASVEQQTGTAYTVTDGGLLQPLSGTPELYAGDAIRTGGDGGLALRWGQRTSIRLDRDTGIALLDGARVALTSGRLYVDNGEGARRQLTIETPLGNVAHVGTQFLTAFDGERLKVSVREGMVTVNGEYDVVIQPGERYVLSAGQRPRRETAAGFGDTWRWVEALAPAATADATSLQSLLRWASRETGLSLAQVSPDVMAVLQDPGIRYAGPREGSPRELLRVALLAYGYQVRFNDELGTIEIVAMP